MSYLIIPKNYKPLMSLQQTEQGIKLIKEFFQQNLSTGLQLRRVTAPLFVLLNGVERAVTFPIKDLADAKAEVVHSLAKWKRLTLAEYGLKPGYGIYTDMNAIRADESLGNLHSLYVDQWDWERTITADDRNITFLKRIVRKIYSAMLRTEYLISETYPQLEPFLAREVFFIHSEELRRLYPDKTPKEREDAICRDDGFLGLNGDLLVWNPILGRAMELSSMGIRVDKESMLRQLELCGKQERKELYFHKKLLAGELPLSIGGGIGQSRLCMLFLQKAHIGEIQASIWPEEMKAECVKAGIQLI